MLKKSQLKIIIFLIIIYTIIIQPLSLSAQIIITEIMYNPDGSDSGREWVEVYNSGSESVDISDYKLLENNVNHKLSAHDPSNVDNLTIAAGEYVIIADNSTKFLLDYTEKGLLIDSAFSLKNTGEEVSVVNSIEEIINSFNYLPEMGADGTGNSLQLNDSIWIPAEPTPFEVNMTEPVDESVSEDEDSGSSSASSGSSSNSSSDSTHSSVSDISNYKPKINLKVSAGRERYATLNSEVDFELIHNQDTHKGLSVNWSMGDGTQLRGRNIDHIYNSAGTFNVVLNVENEEEIAVSRTKVYVSEPVIELDYSIWGKTVDVLLKNTLKKEINVGGFMLKIQSDSEINTFRIVKDTIIDSGQTLNLNHKITDFNLGAKNNDITLYYPNGEKLSNTKIKENNRIYEILSPYLDDEKIAELEQILISK